MAAKASAHPTYEQCWVFRKGDDTDETSSAKLSKWGADGWYVAGVVSRPGLAERVLMEREVPVAPTRKGAKA